MSSGDTGAAMPSTRSRTISGWFTLSSSLRAYDQLTPSATPSPMAVVVDINVRSCQRRGFFMHTSPRALDALEVLRFSEEEIQLPTRLLSRRAHQEGRLRGC